MKDLSPLKPLKILFIEKDLKINSPFAADGHRLAEHRVLYRVGQVTEALAFLHGEKPYQGVPRPDIILIDAQFSQPNPFALLFQIERDEIGGEIPVVIGSPSEFFYSLDSFCYVTKPNSFQQMGSLVRFIRSCCRPDPFQKGNGETYGKGDL